MWPNICRPEWELNCSQHLDLGCFVWVPGHQAKGNGPLLAPDPVAFWAMDSPVRKHGDIAAAETASVQARQGRRLNPTRRGHDNNARPLRMALFTFLFHIATSLGRLVSAATISSFRKPSRLLRFHLFKQMLREAATGARHNHVGQGKTTLDRVDQPTAHQLSFGPLHGPWPIPPSSACRMPRWVLALSLHHMTT